MSGKKSKSVFESLQYAVNLLSNPSNLVLVFPQGKIQSMHKKEFNFEKGIEYILKHTIGKVQILFVATFVEYFSGKKPNVNMYLKEFGNDNSKITVLEECYNQFYGECVQNQILLGD